MRPLLRVIMNGMLMKTCTAKYVDKGVADDVKDITDIEGGMSTVLGYLEHYNY